MNAQPMLRYFIFALIIMLVACQSTVVKEPDSEILPKTSKPKGSQTQVETIDNADKFYRKQIQGATRRTCWTKMKNRRNKNATTFILATGANTGKLKYANQDAEKFKQAMQKRFGVPPKQVCSLKNVYRNEFKQALINLKRWVKANDRVIIFFSGHGSYVRDDNGDEKDRVDDVLVTLDITNFKKPNRFQVVTDDLLVKLVNALPTRCILTFIDACYAGGMYMKPENDEASNQMREKFLAKGTLGTFPRPLIKRAPPNPKKVGRFSRIKGVVFAAAKEDQKAWEDGKKGRGGVFTSTFLEQLNSGGTLKQVFKRTKKEVERKLKGNKKFQQPQLINKNSFCKKLK